MSETRLDPASSAGGSRPHGVGSPGRATIAEKTLRVDRWWVQPVVTFTLLVLWLYTASCHSCRHLIGGRLKHFSRHPLRYRAWTVVSRLNTRHMELAWTTLGTLMVTDAYIALVASGAITDLRFFN